ncbi:MULTISPECIES: YceI family protein [Niastella]|uniref:Polyisoprenoid-binding protein n=1 Tax=Niastella soli TaxID=2821487 RepID=A0ABS3Z342_9BACT|nr:YceI family protein [Niastella soli]MBO9203816.1 polyisoprenoid-binding protein [Niastella soli]
MQPVTKWKIEKVHSTIGFIVKHLMVSNIKGEFKEYEASISTNGEDFLNVEMNVLINSASISTGDAARDAHLKGEGFFHVKKFKTINFSGSDFKNIRDDMYLLNGNLTIKDITRQIALTVESGGMIKTPQGDKRAYFLVTGKISRKDWGLTWSTLMENGGVIVADEILVNCEIELIEELEQIH